MIFRLTRWALIATVMLTGAAMTVYPGGTFVHRARHGYSFFQNSLSDLGATVAWNGRANPGVWFLLAASILLILAGCACVLALVHVYSSSVGTRWLARGGGVAILCAGAALLGAALTPEDHYSVLHGQFTLLAVGSFPIGTALFAAATALDHRFRRAVPICWAVLTFTVLAWAYVMLSTEPNTDLGLAIAVTFQKLVAITLVATLVFQSYEAERIVVSGGVPTKPT